MNKDPIIIVSGEPYSIFLEIFFKSLKKYKSSKPIVLISSKDLLIKQMKKLGFNYKLNLIEKIFLNSKKLNNKKINLINVNFKSNHAGGILGGISSGQDIIATFAVKPTSSILTSRNTIDKKGKNTKISVKGRHDPCVGIRAVPIGEAMLNCVLLDHLLMHKAQCS